MNKDIDKFGQECQVLRNSLILQRFIENRMSKPKGKDKKNDATSLIQKQFEAQKRDIIEYQFTIKKLEQKLSDKTLENQHLTRELEQVRLKDRQTIEILTAKAKEDEDTLKSQLEKNAILDYDMVKLDASKKSLEELLHQQKIARQTEVQALRFKAENEPKMLLKEIEELKLLDRHKYEQEILNLKDLLEYEKAQKTRQLADKQREKVQATDKLRDEMLKKIRQMRTNLLSLKKQQLSTTTRLTILQNHQLTSQLEYQSKQTQKLIFKEQEMHEKIKQLTQELAIHKQVQEELAKRAHFSKGVIKKLNDRIAELENRVQRTGEEGRHTSPHNNSVGKSKMYIEVPEESSNKQILIEVEKQLSVAEKKLSEAQSKLQATEKEKDSLQAQMKKYENTCNDLAKMLIRYSQEIIQRPMDKQDSDINEAILRIDLEELRKKKVEEWEQDEIGLIVKILLHLLKPYLTKKNLLIPAIRRLLVVQDSKLEKIEAKLPKILEGAENIIKPGLKDLPTNIASKIVSSNLREWGQTVNYSENALLKRKYKLSQSHR